MGPRSKNGSRGAIVNNTTGVQPTGDEKRSQHDESGFGDSDVHPGDAYAPVDAALEAAGKKPCNLDDHFGEDAASGFTGWFKDTALVLSLIHISEPTRRTPISYAVFCLKKKNNKTQKKTKTSNY